MANNRIYLKCNICGDTLYLGKTYGDGYYWEKYSGDDRPLEERLNDFYNRHAFCNDNLNDGGDGDFSLEYEDDFQEGKKSAERRGYWTDRGSLSCRCSECGCKSPREFKFCPNCGTRMEE